MRELVSPESIRIASAVAAQREHAQELLGGARQCCQVWGFSPDPRNSTLIGEFQFESRVFCSYVSLSIKINYFVDF